MSNDLMVLDFGGLALPFDDAQAQELAKSMIGGLAGSNFKRYARLVMGNSGDFELIDENGEVHDLGREVNLVVVDQRPYNSRVHYGMTYEESRESGENAAPDCRSCDGEVPDNDVGSPKATSCKECPFNKISKNYQEGNLMCNVYRRIIAVLINDDGTFSDPFVLEPKYMSIMGEKSVVARSPKEQPRFGSWKWYMNTLAQQTRNGVVVPIPAQWVVTTCIPMPKAQTATMKFGVGSTANGGYRVLTQEQFDEIMRLKDSDLVKELLTPVDVSTNNPSSFGRIEVKDVTEQKEEKPKVPAVKKSPAPKAKGQVVEVKETKMVVLGIEHPDVKNSADFDYDEIVEWAKDADESDVKEWLAENFPQALEPMEVPVTDAKPKVPAAKKSPAPKAKEQVAEPKADLKEAPKTVCKTETVAGKVETAAVSSQHSALDDIFDNWDD